MQTRTADAPSNRIASHVRVATIVTATVTAILTATVTAAGETHVIGLTAASHVAALHATLRLARIA